MSCVSCGGDVKPWLRMPIDAKTRESTPYGNAVRCTSCGLGAISPLPRPDEIPAFYKLDAYYTHGESHFAQGERETLFDLVRMKLAWRADCGEELTPSLVLSALGRSGAGLSMLDIGCGGGDMLRAFQKAGFAVAGLDPDKDVVAALQADGLEAHAGGAEEPPQALQGRRFDVVVMSHSLEHCLDPTKALRTARAAIAPGGVFACETPNCASAHFEMFTVTSEMYDAPRHLYFFTPDNLRWAIEEAGFVVERAYFRGFGRHFSNDWRATENRIRDALLVHGVDCAAAPPAHTRTRAAALAAQTAFASPARKYDCIGFIAKTPRA